MYLHFEDWSSFTSTLDTKGIPHGGKIMKIYASEEDPRELFEKPDLVVFGSDGNPFTDEVFDMGERGTFIGKAIDDILSGRGINEKGKDIARALLRFSSRPETQFTQAGMQLKKDGKFLIDHPLAVVDGLKYAASPHHGKERDIHLDIFEPESLKRLGNFVNYNDPATIISFSERMDFRRREGQLQRSKEK